MYVCPKCRKKFDSLPQGAPKCPYCGYRIIYKAREPVAKRVPVR